MKYRTLSFIDAMDLGFQEEPLDERYEYEYRHGIFEMLDNKPIRMIGCDGGEPEDQTLYRDWKWVCPALNAAYEAGMKTPPSCADRL